MKQKPVLKIYNVCKLIAIIVMAIMAFAGESYFNLSYSASQQVIADMFIRNDWWLIITGFWLLGILLGLTPCAIPLILMMTSVCREGRETISNRIAFIYAFIYTLTIGITYSIIGILVADFGLQIKQYFENIFVICTLSLIFVILGLSSLGLFNISLPMHWLRSLCSHNKLRHYGSFLESIFLGTTATLIAAPCIFAPLVGVLTYIANTGDIKFGSIALFCTGIGFGTPLICFFVFGSSLIQKAGEWQNRIRQFFGLILFGIAVWLLGKIIPANPMMFVWSSLAIFTALYMGVLVKDENRQMETTADEKIVCSLDGEEIPQKAVQQKNKAAISRMISVMIFIYGLILFIGALLGNENPMSPLSHQEIVKNINNIKK